MVRPVTNFGRNGIADWVVQRFTAVILAAYTFFIIGYLITNPGLDFVTWQALFSGICVRIFSLLALVSLAAHSWIGLWGVVSDYVTERLMGTKAFFLRIVILSSYALVTFAYLVWGIGILWGIS